MTISDFSVHNVLRTYSKQYRIGKLVKGVTSGTSDSGEKTDAVEISIEGKKIAFIKNLTEEVYADVKGKLTKEEVEQKVIKALDPFIDELVKEFSPEDKEIVGILKDHILELFNA